MMDPKILVTGGTGLLGAYLLRKLKESGYKNLTATFQGNRNSIPQDLVSGIEWKTLIMPDIPDTFSLIEGMDWVVHSAGLISYHKRDKAKLLSINHEGTKHLVNACLAHGVKHLVYVSSIGTLGKESSRVILNETSPWLKNEFSNSYGLSKYLGELEAWRGAGEGLHVSAVLPSVILGTGDWQRSSLQIFDRVSKKSGFYPGGQTGYVDVRDVAAFIHLLLEKNLSGERWILNAENLTYKDLYQKIGTALGLSKHFQPAPKWLAKTILRIQGLLGGQQLGVEVLNHAYGNFTYDSARSLSVEGFSYRSIDHTIEDIVKIYSGNSEERFLKF